jgi:NAD(P)-dependent dehydrogenase (short-subunit alcohol dehydrogenase family)
MARRRVLVTGANGYIGNAAAKAFSGAGWKTYGLMRRMEDALNLTRNEIHPFIGSPVDSRFLDNVSAIIFDVVVSNTHPPRLHCPE